MANNELIIIDLRGFKILRLCYLEERRLLPYRTNDSFQNLSRPSIFTLNYSTLPIYGVHRNIVPIHLRPSCQKLNSTRRKKILVSFKLNGCVNSEISLAPLQSLSFDL